MRYLHIMLMILGLFPCFGCTNNDRISNEITELMHRQIVFDDGYKEYTCKSEYRIDELLKHRFKIVVYLGEISCSSCGQKTIEIWQREVKKIDENVPLVLILRTNDSSKIEEMMDCLNLEYPVMSYDSDVFEIQNNLQGKLARNQTFLLDKDNKVVLVGEPLGREKLTELYRKCIRTLTSIDK